MTDSPAAEAQGSHAQGNKPAIETASSIAPDELQRLTDDIVAALKTVYDPEIPADIYELGLIYSIDIDDSRFVAIDMTLTAPHCPVAESIVTNVRRGVSAVEGVSSAEINLVWDPPWTKDRMSEAALLELGLL